MNWAFKDFIELTTCTAITLGVILSYFQIRKISRSIETGQQANTINVLNSFTKEYDEIMLSALECNTQKKVATWYLRYWNLLTNEYLFFKRGLLDASIFEFWIFRLCLYYNEKPNEILLSRIDTFKKSHLKYLDEKNENYPQMDAFFREFQKISEEKDRNQIKKHVHKLVKKCK